MKKGAQFWLRIASVLFLGVIVFLVPAILFPFGLSLILAILLKPMADWFRHMAARTGASRIPYDLWIALSFIVFAAVLYLIAAHVLVPFIKEFKEFAASVPGIIDNIRLTLQRLEVQYQLSAMPPEMKQLVANTLEKIGSYTLQLASVSVSAVFSFAGTMVELIIVPIITFYMIKKGDVFCEKFIALFPESYSSHLHTLFHEIHYVLSAYIRGQLALCVLMSAVVFVGMMALGIPYPLVIGLLAGLVEMIPILGPIIGAVPPVLLGLSQGSAVMVKVILFYVIVQQLDSHLVMPKLMGSIINVHPVAIILGVLVGGHLYGIVGMMIAVPLLAVLQVLLKHMWFYDRYRAG